MADELECPPRSGRGEDPYQPPRPRRATLKETVLAAPKVPRATVSILVLLLAACLCLAVVAAAGWAASTQLFPALRPPPTAEILADCFWSADVFAWTDSDGNGAHDEAEQPLEGVEVSFSPTFLSGAATGPDGRAHAGGMYPGACLPDLTIDVVVTGAPEGYTPTTETAIEYSESVALYEFGFQPLLE